MIKKLKLGIKSVVVIGLLLAAPLFATVPAYAVNPTANNPQTPTSSGSDGNPVQDPPAKYHCGSSSQQYVNTSIDLGCQGKGNPILDLMFAVIRFLSIGVGLVIVGSLVYAGIQYIGSRGDPNANALAVKRIQSNVTALLLFVFAFAILNYIIPGQFLK